ncbi:hypothetical protein DER45DRAFT_534917 [Fusarium avenaceum]|nr:hypothetical protein DER45DRAFT_534917 [Fusarium avenaceum]
MAGNFWSSFSPWSASILLLVVIIETIDMILSTHYIQLPHHTVVYDEPAEFGLLKFGFSYIVFYLSFACTPVFRCKTGNDIAVVASVSAMPKVLSSTMTRPPYPRHRCKKSDGGSPEWKAGFTP